MGFSRLRTEFGARSPNYRPRTMTVCIFMLCMANSLQTTYQPAVTEWLCLLRCYSGLCSQSFAHLDQEGSQMDEDSQISFDHRNFPGKLIVQHAPAGTTYHNINLISSREATCMLVN